MKTSGLRPLPKRASPALMGGPSPPIRRAGCLHSFGLRPFCGVVCTMKIGSVMGNVLVISVLIPSMNLNFFKINTFLKFENILLDVLNAFNCEGAGKWFGCVIGSLCW